VVSVTLGEGFSSCFILLIDFDFRALILLVDFAAAVCEGFCGD